MATRSRYFRSSYLLWFGLLAVVLLVGAPALQTAHSAANARRDTLRFARDTAADAAAPRGHGLVKSQPLANQKGLANGLGLFASQDKKILLPGGSGASAQTPNSPLAQPNDLCTAAIPIALRQSVDGSFDTAANDYTLACGVGCFTGAAQTTSTAVGRDVVYSFTAPIAASYSFKEMQPLSATPPTNPVIYMSTTCPGPGVVAATRASNRNTGLSEEIDCVSLTAGQQVFIFVDETAVGVGATNEFNIEVTQCQRETEPNGTTATANTFLFGVEGASVAAGDIDFYTLGTTVPGSRVFALVDGAAAVTQSTNDFDLRVTTLTDTLEYDDEEAFPIWGTFSATITGTPLVGTSTFLRVNSFGAGTANEPYRLYAIVEPPGVNPVSGCVGQLTSAIEETEPNDTPATANTGPLGYFEGAVDNQTNPDDYFAFQAAAGDFIFASLDLDPCNDNTKFDGDLFLLASDGTTQLTLAAEDNPGLLSSTTPGTGSLTAASPNLAGETLIYRIKTAGTYYLQVNAFLDPMNPSTIQAGDYLLAVSKNAFLGTGPTAAPSTVSGRITDANGLPIAGAVVNLTGTQNRKFITNANGEYSFQNVETNGFYTVRPSLADYSFSPGERSFSQTGNSTEATFTGARLSGHINLIDGPEYLVRQHYLDFLGREPDESGFNFWSDQILSCGFDAACIERRTINVSVAYFFSIEFQQTGGLVDGLYRASYGRRPTYAEFVPDQATIARDVVVGRADWEGLLATNKQAFIAAWTQRADFQSAFGGLSNEGYVDTLLSHTAGFNGNRDTLVSGLNSGSLSRAAALGQIVENEGFIQTKRNETFVMMQYFGYLRRDPDESGYRFWLDKLNQFNGNFEQAEMVKAFLVSGEYRDRFNQ